MAEIGPTTAPKFAQGRLQESPATTPGGRVIPFPQVPGSYSSQAEARTSSGAPDTPGKTAGVAPTGGVVLGLVGTTIIQLVAEQQLSWEGAGARPDRLDRLRAVAAYETAHEVGAPPRAADGGEAVSRPGASLDFLA